MISKRDILNFDTRRRVYNYILRNPGLHLRELSRKTKIPKTTLKYHLKYLKKQNLIIVKSEGGFKRIYISEKLGVRDQELLNLLRQEIPCKILLHLFGKLICSQIELSKELNKRPPTIEFHLKKLLDMGIIEPVTIEKGLIRRNRESCYILGRNPIKNEIIYRKKNSDITLNIHRLIVKYGDSFPDQKIIAPMVKFFRELDMSKDLPNNIIWWDASIDEVFNILYDIFPHPYHV